MTRGEPMATSRGAWMTWSSACRGPSGVSSKGAKGGLMTSTEATPRGPTRRSFLQAGGTAALTAASWQRVRGANERIGLGFVGYGLIGKRHLLDFQQEPDARV